MFSFPAIPEADFEAFTNGKDPRGVRHAGGHEGSGKDGLFETDADAGAAFARLLEGALACEDGDTEVLRRIVSTSHEAGVDPADLGKLFQVLESFGPMHADGVFAGGASASDTGAPEALSDVSERLGRILAGLAAGSAKTGTPGMQASPGAPFFDHAQRDMASEHSGRPGVHAEGADAALARIVSAFSHNAVEGQTVERYAAKAADLVDEGRTGDGSAVKKAEFGEGVDAAFARIVSAFSRNAVEGQTVERYAAKAADLVDEGRTGDGSAVKKAEFGGGSGRREEARVRLPEMSDEGNEKSAARFGKESQKMRAYLDSLAEQLTAGGKKGPDGRTGLKMTGFRDGIAASLQQAGESTRAQNVSGSQANMAVAPMTGSMSGPMPAMGAEMSGFGGDGSFQGDMAESSGGRGGAAAQDAGNPGASSMAAFDKHLQSPAQALENRVMGQVFMRLFTGAGRGTSSMTVNIHPPEMGSIRVRIVSEHGRMSVHLNAQTQQAAGILERNLPALHQSLADQGIDIDDLHVSVESEGREGAGFEDRAFAGRPAGNPTSGSDTETEALSTDPTLEPGYEEGRGLSLRV